MKQSEIWMRRGRETMNNAQRLADASGPIQVAVCNNRGWYTTDAMGFAGLCQYAVGKMLSWCGW